MAAVSVKRSIGEHIVRLFVVHKATEGRKGCKRDNCASTYPASKWQGILQFRTPKFIAHHYFSDFFFRMARLLALSSKLEIAAGEMIRSENRVFFSNWSCCHVLMSKIQLTIIIIMSWWKVATFRNFEQQQFVVYPQLCDSSRIRLKFAIGNMASFSLGVNETKNTAFFSSSSVHAKNVETVG